MAHYPRPRPRPGTDAYAASRALFDTLITWVSDLQMAGRPEHVVEDLVTGEGREVLKQVLQDHLDAWAAAEPRLAEAPGSDLVVRRRARARARPAGGHHRRPGRGHPDRLPGTHGVQSAPGRRPARPAGRSLLLPAAESGDPRERDRCS